ncbi:MAG: TonB-dependent siderophore receptor [Acidovorax sp.]
MPKRSSHVPLSASGLHPTVLAAAVHLALAGLLLTGWQPAAHAQTAAADARSYDIPAGPLGTVLKRFATESGVLLATTPELVQGRQSPGVRGSYSAQAALDVLLSGTGLGAEGNAQRGYRLLVAATAGPTTRVTEPGAVKSSSEITTLPEVKVTAAAERSDVTEGTGSYAAKAISIGKGGVRSLREVPQTVSVVTRQQIEDQNLVTVSEALDQTTGVYNAGASSTNTESPTYYSRGFEMAYTYDGLSNGASGAIMMNGIDDTATLDHIEVLRGPAALLRSSPASARFGGIVNAVRKKPQSEFSASGQVSAGSWNNYRSWIDIGGPLNDSKSVRARAVLSAGDRGYWYGTTANKKDQTLYGVIEANLTPDTQWSASVTHTRADATQPYTLNVLRYSDGTLVNRNRSAVGTDPRSFLDSSNTLLSSELTHRFDNGWKAQGSLMYQHFRESSDITSWDPEVDSSQMVSYYRGVYDPWKVKSKAYDLSISGPIDFLGKEHKLTFGLDGSESRYGYKNNGDDYYSDQSITNPTFDISSPLSLSNLSDRKMVTSGYYGVGQFKLAPPLTLVLGARVTNYKSEGISESGITTVSSQVSGKITPHAGLIWNINKQTSLYASYADLFVPQSNRDSSGKYLDPEVGWQGEVGIKRELFDGRLNASLALYRIRDTNRAITDYNHFGCDGSAASYCYKAAGLIQSQGVDAEISGSPLPGLQIVAGYTYNQNKYLEDSKESNIGKQISGATPRHLAKLFATYQFGARDFDGALVGWRIGGGVTAQSKTYANDTVRQGGYALVNLLIGYQFSSKTSVTFNVNNLFDRYYTTEIGYYWGAPRSFNLALRHQF